MRLSSSGSITSPEGASTLEQDLKLTLSSLKAPLTAVNCFFSKLFSLFANQRAAPSLVISKSEVVPKVQVLQFSVTCVSIVSKFITSKAYFLLAG